jgi:plasmid stabilization system protein ParE
LRTIGFERRATVAFQVKRAEVVIVRIFHGGQDYERALRGMTEE